MQGHLVGGLGWCGLKECLPVIHTLKFSGCENLLESIAKPKHGSKLLTTRNCSDLGFHCPLCTDGREVDQRPAGHQVSFLSLLSDFQCHWAGVNASRSMAKGRVLPVLDSLSNGELGFGGVDGD